MTEEQAAKLMAQLGNSTQRQETSNKGEVSQSPPTSQAVPTMSVPASNGAGSSQQSLRQRMLNEQRNPTQHSQVVLEQTSDYRPTTQQVTPMPRPTPTSTQPVQEQTPINQPQQDSTPKAGVPLKYKLMGAGGVLVAVVAIAGMFIFSKNKTPDESQSIDESLDDLEWLDPINQEVYLYTPEEITELRAAGYTGTEIEDYQSREVPAEELIQQAEEARDAWIQEAVAPLYDTASDEYKKTISETWLSLPQRTDMEEWQDNVCSYYEVDQNLDYEKIGVYGNQLFIKIYLDDYEHDDWFFLNITTEEWNKLKQAGNIQVHYTYETRFVTDENGNKSESFDSIYIASASITFTNSGTLPGIP